MDEKDRYHHPEGDFPSAGSVGVGCAGKTADFSVAFFVGKCQQLSDSGEFFDDAVDEYHQCCEQSGTACTGEYPPEQCSGKRDTFPVKTQFCKKIAFDYQQNKGKGKKKVLSYKSQDCFSFDTKAIPIQRTNF